MMVKALFLLIGLTIPSVLGQTVIINEILASNTHLQVDPLHFNFSDWIELYNPGTESQDLSGYYLSDDFLNPQKWQIPPGTVIPAAGYLVFWADGTDTLLHTNFGLSKDGEIILLTNQNAEIIDSLTFPPQVPDISFGRATDNPSLPGYFHVSTPGMTNPIYSIQEPSKKALAVEISQSGGHYSGPLNLELSSKDASSAIYYTIDGSIPSPQSTIYTKPFNIDTTTVVRARIFQDGHLPGPVVTNSYFISQSGTLPIVSMATDPDNLWDPEIGVYVEGTNGIAGWGGIVGNFQRDWERRYSFEFFDSKGDRHIQQDVDVKLMGAVIRLGNQKAFSVSASGKYNFETLSYPFFPNNDIKDYHNIVLRNSGNDQSYSFIRDGMMQLIASGSMNIDVQSWHPVELYLNGNYWGLYNLREKQNEHYLAAHHGVDPSNVVILEGWGYSEEARASGYSYMLDYIANNDLSDDYHFNRIHNFMDIDEFIDYQILNIYCANTDWPGGNIKYWKSRTAGSKWRWLSFDLDFGFGLIDKYDHNTLVHATSDTSTFFSNPPWSTFLLRSLLKNKGFKNQFLQRFAHHINITFSPERVHSLIDSMSALLEPEMPQHISKWGDSTQFTPYWSAITSMDYWGLQLEELKYFASQRPEIMRNHLIEMFGRTTVTLNIKPLEPSGKLFIDNIHIPSGQFNGEVFEGIPIFIEVNSSSGNQFSGWKEYPHHKHDTLTIIPTKNMTMTPQFGLPTDSILPSHITENQTLSLSGSPYLIPHKLTIDSNSCLDIEAGVQLKMGSSANILVHGCLNTKGQVDKPVIIQAQHSRNKWGGLMFDRTTHTSRLAGLILKEATHGDDPEKFIATLSGYYADLSLDNITIEGVHQPIFTRFGSLDVKNSKLYMSGVGDLINVKQGKAHVTGCDLRGNHSIDTDAIDYDGVHNGTITHNKIYDFVGFNSDGIDLGESSSEILIKGNTIYNCNDKGISIGQASSGIINNNLILSCGTGIGIKDSASTAFVTNNTLSQNNIGIHCFEKNSGKGGGAAQVLNSIFNHSINSDIVFDQKSNIEVDYSLSNSTHHKGTGNIFADPMFIPSNYQTFYLSELSPAINTGDPNSKLDSNGTRADMGAIPWNALLFNIKITEFHFHPTLSGQVIDWVEIFNPTSIDIDLSGWSITTNNTKNYLISGSIIKANSYALIKIKGSHIGALDNNINIVGTLVPHHYNSNIQLILVNKNNQQTDSLNISQKGSWPQIPRDTAGSLELIDVWSQSSSSENWAWTLGKGTPGISNSIGLNSIIINEINYKSSTAFDAGDWVEFYNIHDKKVDISGWYFTDSDDSHILKFPYGTYINPHSYLVLSTKPDTFNIYFPNIKTLEKKLPFSFSGNGEYLNLFNHSDMKIDSVYYSDTSPWPSEADGMGSSLELKNPQYNNNLPESWEASRGLGTPGAINSRWEHSLDTLIPGIAAYGESVLAQNYPNPFSEATIIKFFMNEKGWPHTSLKILNVKGKEIAKLVDEPLSVGVYTRKFSSESLPNGIYFILLQINHKRYFKKMIISK